MEICITWRDARDDAFLVEQSVQFLDQVVSLAEERGLEHSYIFPNYAWPRDRVMQSYGSERLELLKTVALKWDPDGFFQHRVTGGYKISK